MNKLLLVIPTLDPSGAEKQFTLLATGLPRDQWQIEVVVLTRGGPFEQDLREHNIPVTVLHKRLKFDPATLLRLRKIIRRFQPDIIHTWLFAANSYVRLLTGKSRKPAILVSERCVDSWKQGWQLWLDRRQIRRTTRMIGNSQSVAEFYRQLGVPSEKLVVIPNAVTPPAPPAMSREEALAEFNLPPGANVVGYVGRLAKQKRVEDLIWAFQLLRQLRSNISFLVIGDGSEKAKLIDRARHFECDHLIRFAGHRSSAKQFMHLLDVIWLASDFEGMSNSIMEGMAAGVVPVVSDIPPNRELVDDGENGFLVQVGDSVGFAQFTDRILADPELKQRLSEAATRKMREQFSPQQMIDQHQQLYREVLQAQ